MGWSVFSVIVVVVFLALLAVLVYYVCRFMRSESGRGGAGARPSGDGASQKVVYVPVRKQGRYVANYVLDPYDFEDGEPSVYDEPMSEGDVSGELLDLFLQGRLPKGVASYVALRLAGKGLPVDLAEVLADWSEGRPAGGFGISVKGDPDAGNGSVSGTGAEFVKSEQADTREPAQSDADAAKEDASESLRQDEDKDEAEARAEYERALAAQKAGEEAAQPQPEPVPASAPEPVEAPVDTDVPDYGDDSLSGSELEAFGRSLAGSRNKLLAYYCASRLGVEYRPSFDPSERERNIRKMEFIRISFDSQPVSEVVRYYLREERSSDRGVAPQQVQEVSFTDEFQNSPVMARGAGEFQE